MANGSKAGLRVVDTQQDWSGGVDSSRVPEFQSRSSPHGLGRNELAWLESGTVRGGGISSRDGVQPLVQGVKWPGVYQGGFMYEPLNGNPYLMLDIGGRVYQVRVDTDNSVHDATGSFPRSATIDQHWHCQAEEFLIFQDGAAEPLVWNGSALNKISGMGGIAPYLPTGTAMAYQNGRVFVASGGRQYLVGDIVNGPPNLNTSNVLHASENSSFPGGGGFIVPSNAGNIRGIAYTSNINQPVSVGTIFIGTRKAIYAFNGGTQRFPDANGNGGWALTQGLQTVAQYGNGFVNDRSIVGWNGDLFFQTLEPGVRSLALSVRYSNQWANVPLSNNENRVLALANRALLRFGSGIEFNNRLFQTTLPFQTALGVAHKLVMSLDFDVISSFEDRLNNAVFPAWEGAWDFLDVLQLFQGDFGGLQRAFAVVISRISNQIEVWEIGGKKRDNGDNRITFQAETGAFDWGNSDYLKELETMDLWYDDLFGTAEILVEYRPEGGCWNLWHQWRICTSRSPQESGTPVNYPYPTQTNCPCHGLQSLPKPPAACQSCIVKRPTNIGNQFQFRFTIKGNLRIRGLWVYALLRERAPFENLACGP